MAWGRRPTGKDSSLTSLLQPSRHRKCMKKLVIFLLMCMTVMVVWGQNTGRRASRTADSEEASPVSNLLKLLLESVNSTQAMSDVRAIWENDRWFTFPKFEETAKNVAAMMRRAGLEDVEIGNAPADGVTQAGFWTEPLAWDVKTGTLEIVEPKVPEEMRVLADYQRVPTSVCMWSGPTPAGGVTTEVVLPNGDISK